MDEFQGTNTLPADRISVNEEKNFHPSWNPKIYRHLQFPILWRTLELMSSTREPCLL